jgi:hypothetical protein
MPAPDSLYSCLHHLPEKDIHLPLKHWDYYQQSQHKHEQVQLLFRGQSFRQLVTIQFLFSVLIFLSCFSSGDWQLQEDTNQKQGNKKFKMFSHGNGIYAIFFFNNGKIIL